jgi:hypothetical protein
MAKVASKKTLARPAFHILPESISFNLSPQATKQLKHTAWRQHVVS